MKQLLFALFFLLATVGLSAQESFRGYENDIPSFKDKVPNNAMELYAPEELREGISDSLGHREMIEIRKVRSENHGAIVEDFLMRYENLLQVALEAKNDSVRILREKDTDALDSFMTKKQKKYFGVESKSSKEWAVTYQEIASLGVDFKKAHKLLVKFEDGKIKKETFLEKIATLKE